jgi:four helix bundle protein
MPRIESFRDLDVYQMALKEAKVIFQVTKTFPTDERYSLTSQIRRSSRAVCAMLAEAWARRKYEGAFANKVNEALAEAMETQSWLDHALECEYIDEEQHRSLDAQWQHIGGKLMRMEQRAETFTRHA